MNRRNLIKNIDGTISFYDSYVGEVFHSTFGAINESNHIFIQSSLDFYGIKSELNILEIGWGTGLNSFLTLAWQRNDMPLINYTAIELFPLAKTEYEVLNFHEYITGLTQNDIFLFHELEFDTKVEVSENFYFSKLQQDIECLKLSDNQYDICFFDAFSPNKQPNLWTAAVFQSIYKSMKMGGVLTTYSVKGDVRRALISVGFEVEKISGPIGKREILRAIKK